MLPIKCLQNFFVYTGIMLNCVRAFFSAWYLWLGHFIWRASQYKGKVNREQGVAEESYHIASWLSAEPVCPSK